MSLLNRHSKQRRVRVPLSLAALFTCGCPAGSGLPLFDGFVDDGVTVVPSSDSAGRLPLSGGGAPSLSPDGRFVAFTIFNVDIGDTEVFARDLLTDELSLASVASDRTPGDRGGAAPRCSGDGRFIAFASSSTNLVAGDTNGLPDVFVHDRQQSTTRRVSVDSNGAEAQIGGFAPSISADGTRVAFASTSDDLVPGDTNESLDIFVHDLTTGMTQRVSVDSHGDEVSTEGISRRRGASAISADGRHVAFSSDAPTLVAGDTNDEFDVFAHDLQTGVTTRVSVDSNGDELPDASVHHAISADGRLVAFVAGHDVFVHDRDADGNGILDEVCVGCRATTMIDDSALPSGESIAFEAVAISGDGRFVAFQREVAGPLPPPEEANRFDDNDVFVHDRLTGATERVSADTPGVRVETSNAFDSGEITIGVTNESRSPSLSHDGRVIAYDGDLAFSFSGLTDHVFVETRSVTAVP